MLNSFSTLYIIHLCFFYFGFKCIFCLFQSNKIYFVMCWYDFPTAPKLVPVKLINAPNNIIFFYFVSSVHVVRTWISCVFVAKYFILKICWHVVKIHMSLLWFRICYFCSSTYFSVLLNLFLRFMINFVLSCLSSATSSNYIFSPFVNNTCYMLLYLSTQFILLRGVWHNIADLSDLHAFYYKTPLFLFIVYICYHLL